MEQEIRDEEIGSIEPLVEEPTVKISSRSDVMAEDINSMMVDMIDAVLGIVALSDAEQDELWDKLLPQMEEFFGYPSYRSYN